MAPLLGGSNMKRSSLAIAALAVNLVAYSSTEVRNWIQRSPSANPPQRSFHDMAYDSVRHKLSLFGGSGVPDGMGALVCCYDDTWNWDGVNWTQDSAAAPHPSARAAHGMTFDSARSQVVLFGGYPIQG